MRFEWDETKNQLNIAKHGISFEQAKRIFSGFTVDIVDDRYEYDELCEISFGTIDGVVVVAVVHTDRNDICRIISARPALKNERKLYEHEIQKAFEH